MYVCPNLSLSLAVHVYLKYISKMFLPENICFSRKNTDNKTQVLKIFCNIVEVLQSSGLKVHLHLKRTDINELPQENAELQKWLMKQFEDKDR